MKLETGKILNPFFIIIYGSPGVGKSTFASHAPNPIFIDIENGTKKIDVTRYSDISEFEEFFSILKPENFNNFDTIVLDTLDYLEKLIFDYVCNKYSKSSINDFMYGKGHELVLSVWASVLNRLKKIRNLENGKNIILIAHENIKKFENPLCDTYDKYNLKLNQKSSAFIVAQVDAVFFMSKSFHLSEDVADKKRKIAKKLPGRIIYTEETPSITAKNRYGLDPEIKIKDNVEDYKNFFKCLN